MLLYSTVIAIVNYNCTVIKYDCKTFIVQFQSSCETLNFFADAKAIVFSQVLNLSVKLVPTLFEHHIVSPNRDLRVVGKNTNIGESNSSAPMKIL
jgi:hypothetical protein